MTSTSILPLPSSTLSLYPSKKLSILSLLSLRELEQCLLPLDHRGDPSVGITHCDRILYPFKRVPFDRPEETHRAVNVVCFTTSAAFPPLFPAATKTFVL